MFLFYFFSFSHFGHGDVGRSQQSFFVEDIHAIGTSESFIFDCGRYLNHRFAVTEHTVPHVHPEQRQRANTIPTPSPIHSTSFHSKRVTRKMYCFCFICNFCECYRRCRGATFRFGFNSNASVSIQLRD